VQLLGFIIGIFYSVWATSYVS